MESITKFFAESFNITTAIIVVIVIVIAVYLWRQRNEKASKASPSNSAQPSADDLLDKLEKSGAITRQPSPDPASP